MTRARQSPAVGMGATIQMWNDRHACTIIRVTPKTVTVQRDYAVRTDSNGMSESQTYQYTRDPHGVTCVFRLHKDGAYRSTHGHLLCIGVRRSYYDYTF